MPLGQTVTTTLSANSPAVYGFVSVPGNGAVIESGVQVSLFDLVQSLDQSGLMQACPPNSLSTMFYGMYPNGTVFDTVGPLLSGNINTTVAFGNYPDAVRNYLRYGSNVYYFSVSDDCVRAV